MAVFRFKKFDVRHSHSAMKVGTDGVLLGAWADVSNSNTILDIGAGTGLIALMLAQRTTNAQIHAVEIDADAYNEMSHNFQESPWNDRLQAFHTSIQSFSTSNTYDLIVSNPPYFKGGTKSHVAGRKSARHEDQLPQNELVDAASAHLTPNGRLCLILPYPEGLKMEELANKNGLYLNKVLSFCSKQDRPTERLLMEFSKIKSDRSSSQMIHYDSNGEWTEDYKLLTKDFYLKL